MNIIILGAGQVGSSVASNLAKEDNNITVVDTNENLLKELQGRLDIGIVLGHASYPSTLKQAGANDAEMIIAVTNSDETNIVACQIADKLFRTPTKIARIRSNEYLDLSINLSSKFSIDLLISPELVVTDYIKRLIEHPGALQVLDFAGGQVRLVAVKAYYGSPLVKHKLRTLEEHLPNIKVRVAAIFRHGKAIIPEGDTVIESDDEIFYVSTTENIREFISELRRQEKPFRRIMIAGGGNIGVSLAKALEKQYDVKVIEMNQARTELIAKELHKSIVLLGDATDRDLLLEEDIDNTDVFCALTNDDDANVLSAMLAKRLGAHKVMALINRPAYVDLVESSGLIDIAISPQQATIGNLLAYVRRGDVVVVHSLRKGAAEAIEAIAHGDASNSKVVGRKIEDIKLPYGTTIGAIVRKQEVIIAHHDTVIESDDHVILFLVDKNQIVAVEKLFQVGFTYFS